MELKHYKETVIKVDYIDLNNFIAKTYGLSRFEGTLESPNDTVHRFNISEPESDDMWEFASEDAQVAIEDENCEYYQLGNILERMAREGHIERGVYLVDVCW